MSNILLLSGISGSGKSSFAKKVMDNNPTQYVIVNRDKIRELLFGYTEKTIVEHYTRDNFNDLESQVTATQDLLISFWLKNGKTVIVDNTNLRQKYIKEFDKFGVPVEVKFFDVTLKEAITRDMGRVRQVGEEIITKQYSQYLSLRSNLE